MMDDKGERKDAVIWLNGSFTTLKDARISPLDRGFLYGDGLFETLRADKGEIFFLPDHLDRLRKSAAELRLPELPRINWDKVLKELLRRNDLARAIARVKIILTRGIISGLGLPPSSKPTLCLIAEPYSPPGRKRYHEGWRLFVYRAGFSPPLAEHKSLNYLFYLKARQKAADAGKNEAIVLDPKGYVAETATGSLLFRRDNRWWKPKSAYQLPGITQRRVIDYLNERGAEVREEMITLKELLQAETVWVTNSLIGVMPIREIDGQHLPSLAQDEAEAVRNWLFSVR